MAEKLKREKKPVEIPESRDFKGIWIPERLYLTREFSPNEKFLLIEIYSLTKTKSRECFASNKHFADFVGLKENTVQKMMSKFEKNGYLKREYEYRENTKEIDRRTIKLTKKFYDDFINETDKADSSANGMENNPEPSGIKSMNPIEKNPVGSGLKSIDKYNSIKSNNDLSDINLSDTLVPSPKEIEKERENNSPKGSTYNSHSGGNEGVEKPSKTLSESDLDNLVNQMPLRARKLCYRMTEDKDLSANVGECVEYFLTKHREHTGERHNVLTDETLQKIVKIMTEETEIDRGEYSSTYAPLVTNDLEDKSYKRIIDIYFKTRFRQKIDYSIVHFTSDRILTNMMNRDYELWYF